MKTNEEWLRALRAEGAEQDNALKDLRDIIIHGMLAYLTGHRGSTLFGGSLGRQIVEDCAQESF
jgi:hypothetical protein